MEMFKKNIVFEICFYFNNLGEEFTRAFRKIQFIDQPI